MRNLDYIAHLSFAFDKQDGVAYTFLALCPSQQMVLSCLLTSYF